jgi:hypothetical protein
MTPAELRRIGKKLYGRGWKSKLAAAVPVSDRMIRYWLTGEREIREVYARRIRSLAAEAAGRRV